MKAKQYYLIHSSLVFLVLFPLFMLIYILFRLDYRYVDFMQSNQWLASAILLFGSLFVLLLTYIILKRTGRLRMYSIEYIRRQYRRRIKSQGDLPGVPDLERNLPAYDGNHRFTVSTMLGLGIKSIAVCLFFIPMIVFIIDEISKGYLPGAMFLFVLGLLALQCYIIYRIVAKSVIIDEVGVHRVSANGTKTFKWETIKTIGVSVGANGYRTIPQYIFFSKHSIKRPICILRVTEDEKVVALRYRPRIMHCIHNYWDGDILNTRTQKSWYRYLKRAHEQERYED